MSLMFMTRSFKREVPVLSYCWRGGEGGSGRRKSVCALKYDLIADVSRAPRTRNAIHVMHLRSRPSRRPRPRPRLRLRPTGGATGLPLIASRLIAPLVRATPPSTGPCKPTRRMQRRRRIATTCSSPTHWLVSPRRLATPPTCATFSSPT